MKPKKPLTLNDFSKAALVKWIGENAFVYSDSVMEELEIIERDLKVKALFSKWDEVEKKLQASPVPTGETVKLLQKARGYQDQIEKLMVLGEEGEK